MTTAVRVEAHCSAELEVTVDIVDSGEITDTLTIQHGETQNFYCTESRTIVVSETKKVKE